MWYICVISVDANMSPPSGIMDCFYFRLLWWVLHSWPPLTCSDLSACIFSHFHIRCNNLHIHGHSWPICVILHAICLTSILVLWANREVWWFYLVRSCADVFCCFVAITLSIWVLCACMCVPNASTSLSWPFSYTFWGFSGCGFFQLFLGCSDTF